MSMTGLCCDFTGPGRRERLASILRLAEREKAKGWWKRLLDDWMPFRRSPERWLMEVELSEPRGGGER